MASSTRPAPSARQGEEPRRTYVLDTSVLLSDPRAITRFKEHEVAPDYPDLPTSGSG